MHEQHAFDQNVFDNITQVFESEQSKRIVDLGCGRCDYFNRFVSKGFDVIGVDGNPDTKKYATDPSRILIADLTQDLYLLKFDAVMCLEVGEHVPAEFEDKIALNIFRNLRPGGILILSWAIEGQGGYGHVNCRNNDYIKEKFVSFGFTCEPEKENLLRQNALLPWFRNTLMVFRKNLASPGV